MMNWLQSLEFLYPWVLTSLPICFIAAVWQLYKSKPTQRWSLPTLGTVKIKSSLKSKIWPVFNMLPWFGIAFLCIALARPRIPLKEENEKTNGIDIVLAMDISSSMLAKDFNPNRIEACKELAIDFTNKRPSDRIGLVIFAGEAYTLCPLTTDHPVLTNMISQVQVGILEDNTAIGMGLSTAVKRLKDAQSASKVIILLTDGENNAGYIDPLTAADLAKTYDVKIYTIAVGTEGIAMVPSIVFGRGRDIPTKVSIDTELLTKIATETGGKFYRATDNVSLRKIYDEIDLLEKTEIEMNVFKRYSEAYRPFVYVALAIFLIFMVLKSFFFRIVEKPAYL